MIFYFVFHFALIKNNLVNVNATVHYLYGVANVFIKGEIVRSCDEKLV
jgi:hypothetical protein